MKKDPLMRAQIMKSEPNTLMHTLAQHDAAINGLSSRIGHVEKTLGDHGNILHTIEKAVTRQDGKIDGRPIFNFHQAVGTVLALAVLFSMVVGGIIWVTTSQFAGVLAKQESINANLNERAGKHEAVIEKLAERVGWVSKTETKR